MLRHTPPKWIQMADEMAPRGHGASQSGTANFQVDVRMFRLGMRDRSWLTLWESNMQRIKEQDTIMTKKAPMQTMRDCSHPEWKRHGNIHGSFATCLLCHMKAKWNTEQGAWQSIGLAGSRRSSLPLPSSSSILPTSRTTQSKSKARLTSSHLLLSHQTLRNPSQAFGEELPVPEVFQMDFEDTGSQDLNYEWEHQG